uniref:(northern house mosquito) hypothetical protein n=1 Tax=Culex pipiens TaxID=7175 RepID=A0A8D8P7I6_CULPI
MVQILGGPGDDQQGGGRDAFADHQDGQLRTGPRHQHQQTVHPVLELDRAGEIRQHLVPVHGQGVFVNIDGRQQLIRGNHGPGRLINHAVHGGRFRLEQNLGRATC